MRNRDPWDTEDESPDSNSRTKSNQKKSIPWVKKLVQKVQTHGHILITTYAGVRLYSPDLVPVHWNYVVLDEGHKIRNPDAEVTISSKLLRTTHRIILSGTPIQNNLSELWTLMDFVYPGRLGVLTAHFFLLNPHERFRPGIPRIVCFY
jgi:DNA excision repair protein ERCC-6